MRELSKQELNMKSPKWSIIIILKDRRLGFDLTKEVTMSSFQMEALKMELLGNKLRAFMAHPVH